MKNHWLSLGCFILSFILLFPVLVSAQQAVGVVTALKGKAQLTRAATQTSLRFKDDLNLRDLIDTQERSLARVLFGGKSTVTVRELSRLEVREELIPGGGTRSIHELSSGSILVNVARSLMRRGDEVQIRTPNAIAAVRGSTFFAQYNVALAQSIFILLTGSAIVTPQGLPPVTLAPLTSVNLTGTAAAGVQTTQGTVTQAEANKIAEESEVGTGGRTEESAEAGVQEAAQLSDAVVDAVAESVATVIAATPPSTAIEESTIVEETSDEPTPGKPPIVPTAQDVTSLLQNPGFEKGDLSSWTLSGAGSAVSSLGSITPPNGNFMALIHTGTGSADAGGVDDEFDFTSLKQTFDVASTLLIKFDYNFLTDEFNDFDPELDFFEVTLIDSSGKETELLKVDPTSGLTALTETSMATGLNLQYPRVARRASRVRARPWWYPRGLLPLISKLSTSVTQL